MSSETFALRFKEAREKKNITIKALQPLVGASPSAMNGYATGKTLPPLDVAAKIAKELDVSLDWLCGIEPTTKDLSIHTNSDVLRFLAELVITETVHNRHGKLYGAHIDTEYNALIIHENRIPGNINLSTWANIAGLVRKDVVGADVYRAWIEKTAAEFDKQPFPREKAWLNADQVDESDLPF